MPVMFGIGALETAVISGVLAFAGAFVVTLVMVATNRSSSKHLNNPNLRPCPDCKHFISVRAATCPHCGGPVKGL